MYKPIVIIINMYKPIANYCSRVCAHLYKKMTIIRTAAINIARSNRNTTPPTAPAMRALEPSSERKGGEEGGREGGRGRGRRKWFG